jgi:hypothetical protein
MAGGMTQAVESLPSKQQVLSSNPSTDPKKSKTRQNKISQSGAKI